MKMMAIGPKPILVWKTTEGYQEALLGTNEDGVRFSLAYQPTCYRRGMYKLLIEICGGKHHHDWGCFDEQDQPVRYYHFEDNAKSEAETIATVLWYDRCKTGNPPNPKGE